MEQMQHFLNYLPAFLGLGAVAGLLAGLLGIGGGLVLVPAMALLFAASGIGGESVMHLALGTSLASIVFTSLSSILGHQKHRAILWEDVAILAPGILMGAWFGGWLASHASSATLKPVFGIFELGVAVYMLRGTPVKQAASGAPCSLWHSLAGLVIGTVSAIVGIGGGTLTTPYLSFNGVALRNAIATSAACGFPIAVAGSLSYIWYGTRQTGLPPYSLGYVYLPALAGIIVTSMLLAPLGARLTHRLPVARLKKTFALLLVLVAIKLMLS